MTVMSTPDWNLVHGGGVPEGVGRDAAPGEGVASPRRRRYGDSQALLDARAREWLAGTVGEDGRLGATVDASEPVAQLLGGVFPEWDDPLLASLPVQEKGARAVEEHVRYPQAVELGDTRTAVVHDWEQDGVAPPAPRRTVGRFQERFYLLSGEELERGPVEAL
jgi:hypothetical protein